MNWRSIEIREKETMKEGANRFKGMRQVNFETHGKRDNHMDMGQLFAYLTENQSAYAFKLLFGVEGTLPKSFTAKEED